MSPAPPTFEDLEAALEEGDTDRLEALARQPRALRAQSGDGHSILTVAAMAGEVAAVEALLRAGADPEASGSGCLSPIVGALSFGRSEVVERLLAAGVRPDRCDPGGVPLLQVAMAEGDLRSVEALLARGADPAQTDRDDRSASDLLDDPFLDPGVRKRIQQALADPPRRPPTRFSTTATRSLVAAMTRGDDDSVVETLLEDGADPGVELEDGWTPLMAAANQGRQSLADLLLRFGADPSPTNGGAETAADVARRRGHAELAERLAALEEIP